MNYNNSLRIKRVRSFLYSIVFIIDSALIYFSSFFPYLEYCDVFLNDDFYACILFFQKHITKMLIIERFSN